MKLLKKENIGREKEFWNLKISTKAIPPVIKKYFLAAWRSVSGAFSKHIANLEERGIKMPKISKANRKKKIVDQMKSLGNYKAEYDDAINVYLDLIIQYEKFSKAFEKSGYKISEEYTNKAGATNQRKVPLLTALETLRKDIIAYSDRLRLNPKADSVELEPETNKGNLLAQFLQTRSDDK